MKDSELKASLERAEAAYDALVRTRASLGTMLVEAIRRDGGLPEFRQRREDLPSSYGARTSGEPSSR